MGIYSAYKQGLMTFWYWYVRKLNAAWPYKTVEGRKFTVSPGVYKPLENEHTIAEYCESGDRVLDLGCGCGVGAVFAAEKAKSVLATDISEIAVQNTIENAEKFGVTNMDVVVSDMFEQVEGKFDLVIANPPYIATDFEDEENQFATSVRYLPVLFAEVHNHLEDNGRLVVQYPGWFKGHLQKLGAAHGLEMKEVRRMPMKGLGLMLLSIAYLQVGFRSTLFVFEPVKKTAEAPIVDEVELKKAA